MNNYHTHTYRCKHASGDVSDYVRAARLAGLGELGLSDHVPMPDGRWPENRMEMDQLGGYLAAVETARLAEEARTESEGRLRILCGLECEWGPELDSYLREELAGRLCVAYFVSGTHYYLKSGAWQDVYALDSASGLVAYARHFERSLASGLFSFAAHPDLFCLGYLPWDDDARSCARDVLAAAETLRIPLEINGYGMRKPRVTFDGASRWPYPRQEFWDLAAGYDIEVLVNSDAHRPIDTAAGLESGREMAKSRGLRLVETIGRRKPDSRVRTGS